jgi:hypothetical protein
LADFWATADDASNHIREQHSNERRMSSFREPKFPMAVKTVVISWF